MTGYVRKDTTNNIADGNVINAADLDSEFDGVQDAFNASTGHKHDGTAGEGATINALGPTQDVTVSSTLVAPKTTNTVDIGSSALKFKDLFLAGNASVGGTLAVTGVATFTAQPILSSLTASRAVFSDGSKGLVSNAITGTGNVVMSASPTLTGTVAGASLSLSSLTSGRVAYATTAGLFTDSANLTFDGTTLTPNALTVTNAVTLSGGTANGVTYLNGSKVLTSGSALTFDGTNFASTGSLTGSTLKSIRASGSQPEVVIQQTGVASWSIYNPPSSTDLRFYNGSDLLTLNSSSLYTASGIKVGIGHSNPQYPLDVGATSDVNIAMNNSTSVTSGSRGTLSMYNSAGSTVGFIRFGAVTDNSGTDIQFGVRPAGGSLNSTAMKLDSAGNLGLGVTPSAWGSGYKAIQLLTSTLYGTTSRDMNLGANVYVDAVGYKYIQTSFATNYTQYNGVHSWYNAPSGTAGNTISFTQAMTLNADGQLLLGTTSAFDSAYTMSLKVAGATGGLIIQPASDGYTAIQFNNAAGTGRGSISVSSTLTTYNVSSDYRLKNITGPITTSGAYIDSLNPVEGTWKEDGSTFVGLIAHEVQEASRTTVATGTKDGAEMQGMDYSSAEIIANLIAEVKSLRVRVAQLETN
jgi:hypothetical protein